MKKTIAIIFFVVVLLAIYKQQHIRPVEDPKDTPIFQERLRNSLNRFQANEFPGRNDRTRTRERPGTRTTPYSRSYAASKDLVVSGRCGRVTLSWVEEKEVAKKSIGIKRKSQDGKGYIQIKTAEIYDRQEEQGTRFWSFDSGLTDGVQYEYLASYKDSRGKELSKGPASITLTCNEKDREFLAQTEKRAREYYQKKGISLKDYPAGKRPAPARQPVRTGDLLVAGRCGKVTLSWVEEEKIDKESLSIKRRAQNEKYSPVKELRVYDRPEAERTRYWAADSGLADGVKHEYLISFKNAQGKKVVRGPASINLTCNEKDREILAQREKMIREYYQKKGISAKDFAAGKLPTYQLSREVYKIDLGDSPRKGREDAPVTLVVFTDFECVHCATWAQTLHTIQESFPRDVKVVFKNFPIPYHTQSELAARAALAAGEQGKFWEMHDLLFKNKNALGKEDILGYAKVVGLNLSRFQKLLGGKELNKVIDQDKAQGKSLGVKNTPTTFINGRSLVGAPPVSYIKGVIEDILKSKKSG